MAERIEVGDLVVVVRTCCSGVSSVLGSVFRVKSLGPYGATVCASCCLRFDGTTYVAAENVFAGVFECCPYAWLKKLPPLTEPEHTETREEITV